MGLKDDAIADILAATDPDVLGEEVVIDGTGINAVRKAMSTKDMADMGMDGLSSAGLMLTVSLLDLGYVPVTGQEMVIDGDTWSVGPVQTRGNRVKVKLVRYTS